MDTPPSEQQSTTTVRTVTSAEILEGHRLVQIEHAGEVYRLQVTKNDKLILQK